MPQAKSESVGQFFGVGVGPGDPELLTLKAHRLIQTAPVIAYLSNEAGHSQARHIARQSLGERQTVPIEVPVTVPMTRERSAANSAYDTASQTIAKHLESGRNVVFICEGDPLFFGSFTYLLDRLEERFSCEVVAGISSVNAAAAALVKPLTILQESFVVVSGRHSDAQIEQALDSHDSVVIMKAGQARPRILSLLAATGRTHEAHYLEYIGRENERVVRDVSSLANDVGPYFSLFVVTRGQRAMQ